MLLVYRKIGRLSIHGGGGGEYEVRYASLYCAVQDVDGACDVVHRVFLRLYHGLARRLECSQVYDKVVAARHCLVQIARVKDIPFYEIFIGEDIDHLSGRQVIKYCNLMSVIQKMAGHM